ncbi:MAG TPA: N-acetylglucosamine-6-phosphate deacetylase [Candidatus Angelobacter sp.]|nr:N-acetylglucosamine-6-phosphate deacetylase [Candidatus Angelobacter sp.]
MKTVVTAGSLFTPLELIDSPVVVIEDGRVVAVNSRRETELPAHAEHFDFPQMIAAPGFIDVHVHGNAGHDVMETDDSALAAIERSMARHGVTSYLPTTVTAPEERILGSLEHLRKAISGKEERGGSCPLGIHLEGPFISHARRGVHPPESLLRPSVKLLERFWQASSGTLRMMTIAPELPGATETIQHARRLGVHSSLGHSDATSREAEQGIASGADHATHTFNAMRPLDHREPGVLGAALSDDRLTADIIADGVHVDPSMVKLFLAAKGVDRAILITDAISATGMGDGRYKLGGLEVEVKGDRCEFQGKLAGSVLTLDRAVRNVMSFAGWRLQQSVRLATLNPARLLDVASQKGNIAPGCDADLVILTPEGQVVQTFIAGRKFSG